MNNNIHIIARIADLHEGVNEVKFDGRKLFIYKERETIRVYDSICPHQGATLHCNNTQNSTQKIHNEEIYCKVHDWRFNPQNGKALTTSGRLIEHEASIDSMGNIAIYARSAHSIHTDSIPANSTHIHSTHIYSGMPHSMGGGGQTLSIIMQPKRSTMNYTTQI